MLKWADRHAGDAVAQHNDNVILDRSLCFAETCKAISQAS